MSAAVRAHEQVAEYIGRFVMSIVTIGAIVRLFRPIPRLAPTEAA